MSMEIQGRKPDLPIGRKLHLEYWTWRPIHALLGTLCADLLSERMLTDMTFGQGAGPADQATCTKIAERFERWLEQHPDGLRLESGIRVNNEGRFVTEQELADNPGLETVSPYAAGTEHVKNWIAFLNNCGGFEVW